MPARASAPSKPATSEEVARILTTPPQQGLDYLKADDKPADKTG